jgi:predicted PurR-regulated permease PerM
MVSQAFAFHKCNSYRYTTAATGTPPPSSSSSSSASMFHFRWLVTAGLALEGWSLLSRDWVLTRSIAALAAVAALGAAATVALLAFTNWYLFTREGAYAAKIQPGGGQRGVPPVPPRTSLWRMSSRRLRKYENKYAECDLSIRKGIISSLHFVVAVVLITGGIILVVVIAAFFTVNIAQESSGAVAAAHKSVLERSRSQEGALQQAVEAGTAAWEDAVEKHWPAALAWAQAHVEDVFPGANVTELWVSMQHIYAQIREDDGGAGAAAGVTGAAAATPRWAVVLKEAGGLLSKGDVARAFAHLTELGNEIMGGGKQGVPGEQKASAGWGGAARSLLGGGGKTGGAGGAGVDKDNNNPNVPGMDGLLRVAGAAKEALQARASVILAGAGGGLATVTAWAARASFSVFGVAGGIVNFILKSVVFLTVLFHILSSKLDPAVRLVELIPVNEQVKDVAVASLTRGVRGVFVSCMKLALFHAAFTWVTFRAFGVHFVYTSTLASGATAILPLLASWSVSLPAALGLLAKGQGLKGAALVVMHWVTLVFVDIDIYQSEIQLVHPYIVGLSVVGGMCVFDPALQGAVLGPLLVTVGL